MVFDKKPENVGEGHHSLKMRSSRASLKLRHRCFKEHKTLVMILIAIVVLCVVCAIVYLVMNTFQKGQV